MKAVLLKEDFEKNIDIASRFISSRPQLPILSNILLSFESGKIKLSATNLEVGVTIFGGADVKEKGILTVPARTLQEVLATLDSGRIELMEKDGSCTITTAGASISLPTTPANDFPVVIDNLPKQHATLPLQILQEITRQVIFAAAQDKTKPIFSGVLFSSTKDHLDVVATDGVRLSRKQLATIKSLNSEKLIIPARTLAEVSTIFSHNAGGTVSLATNTTEGYVVFGQDTSIITTRIIDGEFPDFEKIIPPKWTTQVCFDREDLLRTMQLASVFAQDYKVEMHVGENSVIFASRHPQLGNQTSTVSAKISGEAVDVIFNWRFIKDFINSLAGEEVIIELTGPSSPGIFRDPKDNSYLHLIMPIRTVEE